MILIDVKNRWPGSFLPSPRQPPVSNRDLFDFHGRVPVSASETWTSDSATCFRRSEVVSEPRGRFLMFFQHFAYTVQFVNAILSVE
eukprot:6209673-Pleurochrysis_carterae.AAC.1